MGFPLEFLQREKVEVRLREFAAPRRFPPEPVRFLGAHIVRQAIVRKERAENAGRSPAWVDDQLAKLAPAGIEDKK